MIDRARRLATHARAPYVLLALLCLVSLGSRVYRLDDPCPSSCSQPAKASLIFDEAYYVNAARRILGLAVPTGSPYADAPAGLDPNSEHPPLGKVVVSASMRVLGDDPWGWRLPSLVAGLVVVLAIYLLVRGAGGGAWLAVYAAGVASLDNLLMVHSRIDTLDVLFLAPLMVAAVLVVHRRHAWAGVACAVALLVKIPAVFGLAALLLFVMVSPGRGRLVARLKSAGLVGGVTVTVMLLGLWLLDVRFTTFGNPFAHLHFINSYGFDLSRTGGPVNSESDPWQWLVNDVQIPYLRVDTNTLINGKIDTTQPTIWFRGAFTPALPAVGLVGLFYAASRWWRMRDPLACWAVVWSVLFFVPFLGLSVFSHRISYLYYALPLVPAFAVGAALLLWHEELPRVARWGFLVAMALGFVAYFPFRTLFQ